MAEAKKVVKKEVKKEVKKTESTKYKITKPNGKVIYRLKKYTDGIKKSRLVSKGWKVEEV
jgi:hypothetical protein